MSNPVIVSADCHAGALPAAYKEKTESTLSLLLI